MLQTLNMLKSKYIQELPSLIFTMSCYLNSTGYKKILPLKANIVEKFVPGLNAGLAII